MSDKKRRETAAAMAAADPLNDLRMQQLIAWKTPASIARAGPRGHWAATESWLRHLNIVLGSTAEDAIKRLKQKTNHARAKVCFLNFFLIFF